MEARAECTAAVVIAVVGFARVALGLHYLVDVLAGIAISALFVMVGFRLLARYRSSETRRTVGLGIGTAVTLAAVVVAGATIETLALLVVALALFGLSWRVDRPRVAA